MKGIKVQETESMEFFDAFETEYLVQIDGRWYKVNWILQSVLDGRYANSDNVHKWETIGTSHRFSIEPAQAPEEVLPDKVNQFIRRFQETGKNRASLSESSRDVSDYPGHNWGWEDLE